MRLWVFVSKVKGGQFRGWWNVYCPDHGTLLLASSWKRAMEYADDHTRGEAHREEAA